MKQKNTARQRSLSFDLTWKLILAGLTLLVLLVAGFAVWSANSTEEIAQVQTISAAPDEAGNLTVPLSDFTDDFAFVDYGGEHQLLLWRDTNGTVYTAYDSCQECYSRGNAHYTYSNGVLTCAACRNRVNVSTMATASWGGCQPIAIPAEYRADTDAAVVFPAELLQYSTEMFQTWDNGDFSVTLENYAE